MAEPREDRWHERPTALMGGIAIFAGATGAWMLLPAAGLSRYLLGGGTLLFLTGLADDLKGLSPVTKVVAQIAAASTVVILGGELVPEWSPWLSVPLTYLWIIGTTNAVNLLDNMDGLAAGVAGIAALGLAALTATANGWAGAGTHLAVAGAAVGFLVFNYPPARIFMGDCGSLFLGFVLAALAVQNPVGGPSAAVGALVVPAAVMAVPILDTTLVTIRRIASGRSVAQGGRDHTSHRLVFLGLTEERAVLTLYGVSTVCIGLALGLQYVQVDTALAALAVVAVGLAVFGVYLAGIEVREERETGDGETGTVTDIRQNDVGGTVIRAVFRNKQEVALLLADLLLVLAALVLAHHLRFEGGLPPEQRDRLLLALPLVAVLKVGGFWAFGLYRRLLRYAGSEELVRVVQASSVGSLLTVAVLVLAFRFEGFSRSVFVIDWLLTTLLILGVRGGFRGLRGYFAARRGSDGTRVLLYGAGDAGFLALREIRQNTELDLVPAGYIDDDPLKQGRIMHGVPVLGGEEDLARVCRERDVDEVIVTISDLSDERLSEIERACEDAGVTRSVMRIEFSTADGRGT